MIDPSLTPRTIAEWKAAQITGDGLARLQALVAAERVSNVETRTWISLVTDAYLQHQWAQLSSEDLPLYGVPFAVKDNIDAKTFRTTAACPAFGPKAADQDAVVVQRLRAAGAILIGKTNMDQFATGLVGTRSPYGAVPNPLNPHYISGGSSSGSAVSVARGVVPFSLGTDTAGSGRVPAGLNNIYGLKPTRGALSTRGVLPACRSLDCVSIFALTADDAELVLRAVEGFDHEDAYSRVRSPLLPKGLGQGLRRGISNASPTLAICQDPEWYGQDEQASAYKVALLKCARLGWSLVPMPFDRLFALASLLYEGPWVAERWAAISEFIQSAGTEMDPTVRSIIMKAESFSAADAFRAEYARQDLTREILTLFEPFDGLLVPTSPTFPTIEEVADDPVRANSKLGTYTNFVNFLDWCALAVPAGFRSDGLPFGITLVSNRWREYELLELARQWTSGSAEHVDGSGDMEAIHVAHDQISRPCASTAETIAVAVVGAHLSGFPLNRHLIAHEAVLQRVTRTSPAYRLFALPNTAPPKPGLRRADAHEHGCQIELEVWDLPKAQFGNFMGTIAFPLGIGQIELEDQSWVYGFMCEGSALSNALDISDYGGWRAYTNSYTVSSTRKIIGSVLIANRGEIALRILHTIRKLGMKVITIYAEADAEAPHVRQADLALRLDGTTVAETYLNSEKILGLAKAAKVDAIIPGYGFLSENADFAKLVEEHNITWVGPTPKQMSDLGLKHRARAIAQQAGVPTVPGSPELVLSIEHAIAEAERIGFPLMLKSTAGGGGIGLRHCADMQSLVDAFDGVQRLAAANFANDGVFLERFIRNARHVEVQVLGDGKGRAIAAGERDCSLQRRHQKVIEESPALMVPSEVRAEMRKAAVRMVSAVQYRNVGTVEFIYDVDTHDFYFLEVNTRLQVEHPVTESVTGLDLVECMIKIAGQDCEDLFTKHEGGEIPCTGVSIEARIYAEDAIQSFKPCAGRISRVEFPKGLRVDSWIQEGTEVTTSYDPMLAKLIATGKDRREAISELIRGLEDCTIEGIQTNLDYLRQIVNSEDFQCGSYTTKSLDTFQFTSHCIEILNPGGNMTVQDYPGRTGLWDIGVPPSGPMDSLSFRLASKLVGNDEGVAALECTMRGPSIRIHYNTVIAVTGADCLVQLDGAPVSMNQAVFVQAGQILECGTFGNGHRIYISFAHGIDVPSTMGSKSTFELAKIGGFHGRCLEVGDVLNLHDIPVQRSRIVSSIAQIPIPPQPRASWTLGVIPGPHGAPETFTPQGLQDLFDAEWDVHYNSNRLGIRLRGVRPSWARQNGGAAGLHPSNIHDTPYSVGSISFTGDEAIVLSVDGPSLGGFVVFCVVASAELWKLGQIRPGDTIKLQPIDVEQALRLEAYVEQHLQALKTPDALKCILATENPRAAALSTGFIGDYTQRGIKVTARQAGDRALLLEFGCEHDGFQIHQSFEIVSFIEEHRKRPIAGIEELTPGVRSVHVRYAAQIEPHEILSRLVAYASSYKFCTKVKSRVVSLPFAFDDKTSQAAVQRYSETIRSEAPWLPSNISFLEQLNGIDNLERIFDHSTFLVLGLGDVFLGSPCAVSLDPRCRLFGTKYNPSRSHTPKGSVGLGGQYMCIYAMNSPGGYQLVGRTTDIWDYALALGENGPAWTRESSPQVPWLFRLFDRIKFYPITESDLDSKSPEELIKVSEGEFDLAEYGRWLDDHQDDIQREEQRHVRARDSAPFLEELLKPHESNLQHSVQHSSNATGTLIRAPMPGRCWKLLVREGDEVKKDETLVSRRPFLYVKFNMKY
ncbi:urea carboxylase [Stagonosporopsis vannaccii]|nr:urea carboxylase [Stagonosporopsis vannaccii]